MSKLIHGSHGPTSLSDPEYAACPTCETILEDPQLYDGQPCENCGPGFPSVDDDPSHPPDPSPEEMDKAADEYFASQNRQIESGMIRRERMCETLLAWGWTFSVVNGRSIWTTNGREIESNSLSISDILSGKEPK